MLRSENEHELPYTEMFIICRLASAWTESTDMFHESFKLLFEWLKLLHESIKFLLSKLRLKLFPEYIWNISDLNPDQTSTLWELIL